MASLIDGHEFEQTLGNDKGQEEKMGATEDEMVGWHPQLSGHGFG